MSDSYLSDRSKRIDASGIRKVFALAAELEDPINFSIGQPDFDVPEALKRQAIEAIERGFNRYSQTMGERQLCEAIATDVQKVTTWSDPQVLTTSGVSGALLLAFMAVINPGDEIVTTDPYFVIYKHVINMLGGKCVFVDTYPDFQLPVEAFRQAITERTKMIVINSPSNPTGTVYSAEELQALAEVARSHDLIVMSDEIYVKFSYRPNYASMATYYDKTLLLRGFSKAYAMTGWRLGYAATHPCLKPLIEAMTKIQQYTFVCAPAPLQWGALTALEYDVTELVDQYRTKRDLLYDCLKGDFDLVKPEGAFYAFVPVPGSRDATRFVKEAIANNVLVIPGNVFSERDTHFRISYATSNEKIEQGAEILCRLARQG